MGEDMSRPRLDSRNGLSHKLSGVAIFLSLLLTFPGHAEDDLDFLFGDESSEGSKQKPESRSKDAGNSTAAQTEKKPPATSRPEEEIYEETIPVTVDQPEQPIEPKAPSGRVIEEIVVTAQKTEQSLSDVPVTVSAIGGEAMKEKGVFDPEGIENFVPNVELNTDPQSPNIGIRGFSTDSFNAGFEPSVGLQLDDLPLGRTEFLPDGLFDIERVEVLRGPQGTLFGKNTIAGVLNIVTTEPAYESNGQFLINTGPYNELRYEGGMSAPLIDDIAAARLAFTNWQYDGDVENSFLNRREGGVDQNAYRIKLVAEPTEDLSFRIMNTESDTESTYPPWQLYNADPEALAFSRSFDPDTEDNPFDEHTSFNLSGFVRRPSFQRRFLIDYAFDAGPIRDAAITAVVGRAGVANDALVDFDVSAADVANVSFQFGYDQNSAELRFSGSSDSLFGIGTGAQFVGGVFTFESDLSLHLEVAIGTDAPDLALSGAGIEAIAGLEVGGLPLDQVLGIVPGLPVVPVDDRVVTDFLQESEAEAIFGQLTWNLTERFAVILGMRFGSDKKDGRLTVRSVGPGVTAAVIEADEFSRPLSRDEDDRSPKLGFQFDWSDDITTFLTWTRGFKGGGFNGTTFQNGQLEFEPERADNFEFGFKTKWFDQSLQLNGALYRMDVSNMQVVNFNGVGFDVANAAESRLQGGELELLWLPPFEWLTIAGSLGIGSAEYLSYPCAPGSAAENGNPNNPDCNDDTTQDLSGKPLPRAPDLTAAFSPTISLPLPFSLGGKELGLQWQTDISHRGDQFLETDLDPNSRQASYTTISSRLIFGPVDAAWGLILAGDNLTDRKALSFVADHNLYANTYFSEQIPGRSFSLAFRGSW